MLRMALFASAGLMAVSSTGVSAQILLPGPPGSDSPDSGWQGPGATKPRNAGNYAVCSFQDTYKLVPNGPTGPWRPDGQESYPDVPAASCGVVTRASPLKCVAVSTGETVGYSLCSRGNATYNYEFENINKPLRVSNDSPRYYYSYETKDLGACGYDQYKWVSMANTRAACGKAVVEVYSYCVDKDTNNPVEDSRCNPGLKPSDTTEVDSTMGCSYDYSVGELSVPAPSCGGAQKTRAVSCQRGDGLPAGEGDCSEFFSRDPRYIRINVNYGDDPAQQVVVSAMPSACDGLDGKALSDECELLTNGETGQPYFRPKSSIAFQDARSCQTDDAVNYEWRTGAFAPVRDMVCGTNTRTATSSCFDKTSNAQVDDSLCDPAKKPLGSESFDDASGCVTQTSAATCGDAPTQDAKNAVGSCLTTAGVGGADKPWSVILNRTVKLADGAYAFCVTSDGPSFNGAAQPNGQTCGSGNGLSLSIAIEGTGVCASTSLPSCTPAPTPTPPPGPPKEFRLGTCNYSSGSSKYSCSQRANYRPGPAAPYPHDICSGTILSGSERSDEVGVPPNQTDNVGPNWSKPPAPLIDVPGAQCVVHFRSYGYSNSTQEGWQTVYFSGPPTGAADGLFIGPKP